LLCGIAFALIYGVVGWLFVGLLGLVPGGLVHREIDTETRPNRGVVRSLHSATIYGVLYIFIFLLTVGVALYFLLSVMQIRSSAMRAVAGVVLAGGILGSLLHGGSTVFKHLVVRGLLAWEGSAPLRFERFLDFATDRILLHRVANGFEFYHKLLLQYFVSRHASRSKQARASHATAVSEPEGQRA
jgi:hypothetical protein